MMGIHSPGNATERNPGSPKSSPAVFSFWMDCLTGLPPLTQLRMAIPDFKPLNVEKGRRSSPRDRLPGPRGRDQNILTYVGAWRSLEPSIALGVE